MPDSFVNRKKIGIMFPIVSWLTPVIMDLSKNFKNKPICSLGLFNNDKLSEYVNTSRKIRRLGFAESYFIFGIYMINLWLSGETDLGLNTL